MPCDGQLKGHKSLILAGNVLYWRNSLAEPVSPLEGPYGFPWNIEQGRGSSARRLCHKKSVQRVPQRPPEKPPRGLAAVQQRAVPGIPGKPPRSRLQSPQKI